MTKRCTSHTHVWATLYTQRVKRCAQHHYYDAIKSGPKRGVMVVREDCSRCGSPTPDVVKEGAAR